MSTCFHWIQSTLITSSGLNHKHIIYYSLYIYIQAFNSLSDKLENVTKHFLCEGRLKYGNRQFKSNPNFYLSESCKSIEQSSLPLSFSLTLSYYMPSIFMRLNLFPHLWTRTKVWALFPVSRTECTGSFTCEQNTSIDSFTCE